MFGIKVLMVCMAWFVILEVQYLGKEKEQIVKRKRKGKGEHGRRDFIIMRSRRG
jgi:hypothetical protein